MKTLKRNITENDIIAILSILKNLDERGIIMIANEIIKQTENRKKEIRNFLSVVK